MSEQLKDRSSSRVLAPPGGRSNFSLSHDDTVAPVAAPNACQAQRNKTSFDWNAPAEVPKTTHTAKANESHFKLAYSPKSTAPEPATHSAKANESQWKLAYSPKSTAPETAPVKTFEVQSQRNKVHSHFDFVHTQCKLHIQQSSVFSRSPLKQNNTITHYSGVKKQTEASSPAPVTRSSTRVMAPPGFAVHLT